MKFTPTYRQQPTPLDYVDIRLEAPEARRLHALLSTHNTQGSTASLEMLLYEALKGK